MGTKSLRGVEIKSADKGEVSAVFATFDVIDKDGDVTLPGAFDDGAKVAISAYGHKSWEGALPVGAGVIRSTGSEAILEGKFFMDTDHGAATFHTLKAMVDAGLTPEWSYGFDIVDSEVGQKDGRQVRYLKKQLVHEVSPVLLGAGEGTRVLSMKSAPAQPGFKRGIGVHETPTVSRAWDASAVTAAIPSDASPAQLRSVYAWVDSGGDPEVKSSYKFPHHHGVGGPANIRACLAGIASLNGARGGTSVPDDERKAVYAHLAAHLRDADREPPELRAAPGGDMKFAEEGAAVLSAVSAYLDRASEVMALRASKGKGLSPASADLLAWLEDDLSRLKSLLENPNIAADEPLAEDEMSTLLRAVASLHDV